MDWRGMFESAYLIHVGVNHRYFLPWITFPPQNLYGKLLGSPLYNLNGILGVYRHLPGTDEMIRRCTRFEQDESESR